MKKVLLDSNFILTCIKQRIDFFEDLKFKGFKILIPKEVTREIGGIIKSKQKLHVRQNAELALKIIKKNKYEEIKIGKGHVDKRIKLYGEEHPRTVMATLDKELKKSLKNNKLIIREKKRLEVI